MLDCKPADTPMVANHGLQIVEGAEAADQDRYRRIVGKLIYLSHTRPNIAYAVGIVSKFMHQPQVEHMAAVLRILRYLKGTSNKGVFYLKNDNLDLIGYTDVDWAGDRDDRKSTSGYFTFVGGNLVTWKSKKQKVVALSSAEAEFRGIAKGVTEIRWIRKLLGELGFHQTQREQEKLVLNLGVLKLIGLEENVLRLLLEKHPELLDNIDDESGYNVVHQWAELKQIWPFKYVIEGAITDASSKIFTDLINSTTEKKTENNPLHIAAKTGIPEIARALVQGYQKEIQAKDQKCEIVSPWKARNKYGETPLISAILSKDVEMALGESPLLFAVGRAKQCGRLVEEIFKIQDPPFSDLRGNDGTTVLHLVRCCPEDYGKRLLEKYWWMMTLLDDKGKTALSYAKEFRVPWLVNLLKNPSLIQKEPFDWITACEKNENWAVVAFIDSCQDLQKVCREKQDTLHHIRFRTYEECLKFLKKSSIAELKNSTDFEGATPLHRALERKDKHLAKALLIDDVVERNIADNHGTTALNLLSKLCKENDEWESMCKEIKINPHLKTTYIQSRTNLDQMRNTLSVVAALLATITFAAGFTLPGGLSQETGNAMLAKRASFIVFLLADVYAMCTSMLVMYCLIWSMVCDRDMSYLLVDRSVFILMQSLYGTMVAFMTGIYTVINHNTLWVAIVIFVMCSLVGISANRTVLHTIISKFIPASNQDNKDRGSSREQRSASSCRMDESRNAEGSSSHQIQDYIDDHHLERLEEGKASIVGNDTDSKKAK
ncbi:protein ACCELERATED CELL DEATH 6-like [Amaranthus tricolor]|uniref:protein ACCELERATED CELL DEATH 6-like n=1 Tax=Amaranthus tricolor TaxID=29722 RepID=UPI00258765D0|nr:protein ACCELERATED CELL DEATH 6-like [Amaranthus tricolor]